MTQTDTKLQEIIDFLSNPCEGGWSKKELITDMLGEMKCLNGNAADEIGLEWDGETIMVLNDFAEEFYNEIIRGVCNVIKSFQRDKKINR